MAIMETLTETKAESAPSVHTNEIVCALDDFPELTKAVRNGDLSTISDLCERLFYERLFYLNSEQKSRVTPYPIAS
jgi:hypothetical protein